MDEKMMKTAWGEIRAQIDAVAVAIDACGFASAEMQVMGDGEVKAYDRPDFRRIGSDDLAPAEMEYEGFIGGIYIVEKNGAQVIERKDCSEAGRTLENAVFWVFDSIREFIVLKEKVVLAVDDLSMVIAADGDLTVEFEGNVVGQWVEPEMPCIHTMDNWLDQQLESLRIDLQQRLNEALVAAAERLGADYPGSDPSIAMVDGEAVVSLVLDGERVTSWDGEALDAAYPSITGALAHIEHLVESMAGRAEQVFGGDQAEQPVAEAA